MDKVGEGNIVVIRVDTSEGTHRVRTAGPLATVVSCLACLATVFAALLLAVVPAAAAADAGIPDPAFNAPINNGADNNVYAVAVQPDGKILIGGGFTHYNGTAANHVTRLNADGTLDTTFNHGGAGADSDVHAVAVQPDGKILIGGSFGAYNGGAAVGVTRLNADGALDTTFNPGGAGADAQVVALAVQPDGKILIGGFFTTYNGVTAYRVARLNADGTRDTTFNAGYVPPSTNANALAVQPDGKILVGGYFGPGPTKLARLNADGTRDTTFNPGGSGPNSWVESVALQPDGKILIGGAFATYNDAAASSVARLTADGILDTTFNPGGAGAALWVDSVAVQPDGKILIGGAFNQYNGATAPHVARLTAGGALDNTFNPGGAGANNWVDAVAVQPDGKILIGGMFTTYNGTTETYLARLIGARPGLTPIFGTPTPTAHGFTVPITNYDPTFSWAGSATAGGTVAINGSGVVTVTGLAANTTSTVTVTTSKADYTDGSATMTATSLPPAPVITVQPTSQNVTAGADASFTAAATGASSQRWQVSTNGTSWTDIPGATATTLRLPAVRVSMNGYRYRAVFTNIAGDTATAPATLTVSVPAVAPVVTTQPASQTVTAGATATFHATASGTPTPTVRWQTRTGASATWADIAGATATTYRRTAAAADSGRQFRAVFTNTAAPAGVGTRAATLTVTPVIGGSRLTLAANHPAISAGQAVTVLATLRTTAGKALPRARILLCGRPDVMWTICLYLTTGADGTARVAFKPWSSTTYRAAYAGTATVTGSTSNTVRVALRTTHITLAAAPTTVRPGGPVALTVRLKTNAFKPLVGGKVLICGKPAVGWTACWYVSTGADGTARSVLRQPSTTTYLARYVGSKSLDPSLSLPVIVAVRR